MNQIDDSPGWKVAELNLKVGDKIEMMTLFGSCLFTIKNIEGETALAESGQIQTHLDKKEDGYYYSGFHLDKKARIKLIK